MYDLQQFALDIQHMKRHFPSLSVEQFLWASNMGVREQCVAWGGDEQEIDQTQQLAQKALGPVASYLFACNKVSSYELKEAQRIAQQSFSELTAEEQELFGDFGGGGACFNLHDAEEEHVGKHKLRM